MGSIDRATELPMHACNPAPNVTLHSHDSHQGSPERTRQKTIMSLSVKVSKSLELVCPPQVFPELVSETYGELRLVVSVSKQRSFIETGHCVPIRRAGFPRHKSNPSSIRSGSWGVGTDLNVVDMTDISRLFTSRDRDRDYIHVPELLLSFWSLLDLYDPRAESSYRSRRSAHCLAHKCLHLIFCYWLLHQYLLMHRPVTYLVQNAR
ncbi:hypothetical protein F4808DRAFT_424593 [Astrocystis sublimbata]|nr:hypothetical protein F4808DRAFT_424593 [Astrocystis sublimbata]